MNHEAPCNQIAEKRCWHKDVGEINWNMSKETIFPTGKSADKSVQQKTLLAQIVQLHSKEGEISPYRRREAFKVKCFLCISCLANFHNNKKMYAINGISSFLGPSVSVGSTLNQAKKGCRQESDDLSELPCGLWILRCLRFEGLSWMKEVEPHVQTTSLKLTEGNSEIGESFQLCRVSFQNCTFPSVFGKS